MLDGMYLVPERGMQLDAVFAELGESPCLILTSLILVRSHDAMLTLTRTAGRAGFHFPERRIFFRRLRTSAKFGPSFSAHKKINEPFGKCIHGSHLHVIYRPPVPDCVLAFQPEMLQVSSVYFMCYLLTSCIFSV
jgi:hypothetical protein